MKLLKDTDFKITEEKIFKSAPPRHDAAVIPSKGYFVILTVTIVLILSFLIAFFAVWFLKRNIVKCFHYVRTRELVMVLNAAETVRRASTNKKDLLFFHRMRKCNKEFIKTFCRGCPNETLCGR